MKKETIIKEIKQKIITKEEIKKIKQLAKDKNVLTKLTRYVCPHIKGNTHIKEAIILQAISEETQEEPKVRKSINVLVFGEWGSGKSQLTEEAYIITPKAVHIDASISTNIFVNLVNKITKINSKESLQELVPDKGPALLVDEGLCYIENIDGLPKDILDIMGEILDKKSITLIKTNVMVRLNAPAKLLCTSNMKGMKGMKKCLLDRFDLILKTEDIKKEDKLEQAKFKLFKKYNKEFIKKYIFFALQNKEEIKISKTMGKQIIKICKDKRNEIQTNTIKSFPRFVNSLVRLATSSAQLRLSKRVSLEDVEVAKRLMLRSLQEINYLVKKK